MEAVLLIKDTFDVKVLCDSLSVGKLFLVNNTSPLCKTCMGEAGSDCNSAVLITGIICATTFFIALLVYYYCKNRIKEPSDVNDNVPDAEKPYEIKMKENLYQELKMYRSQLANFMEKRAITKESRCVDKEEIEYTTRDINDEKAQEYINKLSEYIKDISSKLEDKPVSNSADRNEAQAE